MKRILIYLTMIILFSVASLAANVGVIVKLADETTYTDCVNIADGKSAYDAFQQTSLDMSWQNFGFGYFLESVEGVSSNDNTGTYWSFWHINSAGNNFEAAMVGAGDYKITTDDKVIGLSYTAFDASFNPLTKPVFQSYDSLCENPIDINRLYAYVDDDRTRIDEGDTISVKPGSNVLLVFEIENLMDDQELENVEVQILIENIDDGDDLEEESDSVDIDEDDKEELEIEFEIPLEVDDEKYDVIVTVIGDADIPFRRILEYKIDVDKESHELAVDIPQTVSGVCGESISFDVELVNIGKNDEDVSLRIMNQELEIDVSRELAVDELDTEKKSITLRIPRDASGEYNLQTMVIYADQNLNYDTVLNVVCAATGVASEETTVFSTVNEYDFQEETSDFTDNSESIKESVNVSYIVLLVVLNLLLFGLLIFLIVK